MTNSVEFGLRCLPSTEVKLSSVGYGYDVLMLQRGLQLISTDSLFIVISFAFSFHINAIFRSSSNNSDFNGLKKVITFAANIIVP